jgi:hypothetical protein
MRLLFFSICLALGGCATTPPPEPVNVTVSGPKFPSSAFECKDDAIPPDPKAVGDRAGAAAGRYESAQRAVTADCRNKLHAVGVQERAAGNVIDSEQK